MTCSSYECLLAHVLGFQWTLPAWEHIFLNRFIDNFFPWVFSVFFLDYLSFGCWVWPAHCLSCSLLFPTSALLVCFPGGLLHRFFQSSIDFFISVYIFNFPILYLNTKFDFIKRQIFSYTICSPITQAEWVSISKSMHFKFPNFVFIILSSAN